MAGCRVTAITSGALRWLTPNGPFAAPSAECVKQLTQAVLEAVIRHVWQIKFKKKANQEGSFDKNVETLHKRKVVSDEWKTKLDEMWAERNLFHHLRPRSSQINKSWKKRLATT